ncbi:MAG: hypothetical protein OQJ81_12535 [Melioribacteraceae bacterium]|nr:hypothetical protein [Melioribacteraceae bacterium]
MFKVFLSLFLFTSVLFPQKENLNGYGTIYKFELNNSPFPHKDRLNGHDYNGHHYSLKDHYSDKSVLIFIPNHFVLKDSIDMVFYFHGWWNNIDSSLVQFNLIEQFYKSNKNAILVLSETAKNAADSFGGKLEEKNIFKDLSNEILEKITSIYHKTFKIGDITLAGHSGAYRVISYILLHGGLTERVEAVYLFDALYADTEKFTYWIDHYNGQFINIYTPNGGTKSESENLAKCLDAWNIPYVLIENDDFSPNSLKDKRIVFIKSELGHNDVIHTQNQFQKFLESSL